MLKTSFQPPAPIPLDVAVVWHPERNTGFYKFLYNVGGYFCLQHLLCKPGFETKSTATKNKSKSNCAHQVWGTTSNPLRSISEGCFIGSPDTLDFIVLHSFSFLPEEEFRLSSVKDFLHLMIF